jgi:cytochrome c-type protein NapC
MNSNVSLLKNRLILGLVVLSGLGLGVAASWAVMDTMIHATGDDAFCSSCHSHQPIGASYRESLHGGNNASGWRATCSNCHIPHDNSLHYLWVKGVHGVVDPTMEILKDSYDIDWHGNRDRRDEYVYDSGCLSCHLYLKESTEGNPKAFRSHRSYFEGNKELSCVGCHQHVGHSRLGYHLESMGWHEEIGDQP